MHREHEFSITCMHAAKRLLFRESLYMTLEIYLIYGSMKHSPLYTSILVTAEICSQVHATPPRPSSPDKNVVEY